MKTKPASPLVLHALVRQFDHRYHASNNPAATRRDTAAPCEICGWARHMAIHDVGDFGSVEGWAHPYISEIGQRLVAVRRGQNEAREMGDEVAYANLQREEAELVKQLNMPNERTEP